MKTELKLSLTEEELDLAMEIFSNQKWKKVNGLIQKLYAQANSQPVEPEVKAPRVRKPKPEAP